ncbi:tripartite motif-containing protein 3-like [Ptychodera flava]|uniref:tripartite motif-containing protein 3-like n=1 Tax=Ptychodera flava TaxID=63121 RepID=UPI003969CBD2
MKQVEAIFKKVDKHLDEMVQDVKDQLDRTPSFPDISRLQEDIFDVDLDQPALGRFRTPLGMGVAHDGNLVVADSENQRLQILNWYGKADDAIKLGRRRFPKPCCPMDVAVSDDGTCYVSDQANEQIIVCSQKKGVISAFGEGAPVRPRGIALTKDGYVLTTDWWQERYCVKKYTKNGDLVSEFGLAKSSGDSMGWPLFLAVNSKNQVFVSDQGNNRIRVFDSDGKFLFDFADRDAEDTRKVYGPTGIHIDADDNVYVCDPNRICVLKYDSSGKFLSEVSLKPYKYENPYAIAVGRQEPRKIAFTEHRGNHIRFLNVTFGNC